MKFLIADTFIDSLSKLTGKEQKVVKMTAFDLQLNPGNQGMQFHKLDRAKDPNFWSIRVGRDIRRICHRTDASLLLCYVGHHDTAYIWAERRKLETHPQTGAAQLVEVREAVKEITVPKYIEAKQTPLPKLPLFTHLAADDLLGYGVPREWVADVQKADEDALLEIADHLPGEAAEALLNLATGASPQIFMEPALPADPFQHPDAQRCFRVMHNIEELERALDYPWEKWVIFLHPAQRQFVESHFGGPAQVSGTAGTGKTIVALQRAVFLARSNPDTRVMLATFSKTLANALRAKLRRLISNEPRIGERLDVYAVKEIGLRLYELNFGRPHMASRSACARLLEEASGKVADHKFSLNFLMAEWEAVVDAWQLETWEAYRDASRMGRKTRLLQYELRLTHKILLSIFLFR